MSLMAGFGLVFFFFGTHWHCGKGLCILLPRPAVEIQRVFAFQCRGVFDCVSQQMWSMGT